MSETHVEISSEERAYLVMLLQSVMNETLVEERRTHSRDYREQVRHREDVIRVLLEKLEPASAGAPV